MADAEEPQFTSLQARIAALNQQGMGKPSSGTSATFGKRAPPPLPPSANSNNRPAAPTRVQTVNNPPISSYGSSVVRKDNNQPIGIKNTPILPPPPVDRDQVRPPPNQTSNALSVPARNAPPPLPGRKASQPSLPPRNNGNNTGQLVRRGSNSSTLTASSTMSALSLGSSTTSVSSTDTQRKLPPAFNDAKLPPLPPSRKAREEKEKEKERERILDKSRDIKIPLVSAKSAPVIPIRAPPVVERDLAPKVPQRPKLPSRPSSRNNLKEEEKPPAQPPRKLPPPALGKSAIHMGFGQKKEAPAPIPGPRPTPSLPRSEPLLELTASSFDRAIEGKFAFVEFYAPYCKYCVELEPVLKQVGEDFSFASDKLVIAKVDVDKYESFNQRYDIPGWPTVYFFDGRSDTPEKYPWGRDVTSITDFLVEKTGIDPAAAPKVPKSNGAPPPINFSSKPSRSQVQAVISRPPPPAAPPGCLICRDFSGPDTVATQHPRQTLPQVADITAYLAQVLCNPFPSPTDKARAIFTWLHHNIAYDVGAFFGNRVKHVEPKDNISSGLAVCGGYAGVFSAIALKAGLEAVTVSGHGKGYGHTPLKPGEAPPPPDPSGHAWNAVRIDGGEWKLLDACWGAGNVGNQIYNKHFTPSYFTMSNEDFGLKHFPENDRHFYRADGRTLSWEEYILGPTSSEPLQIFGSEDDHGLSSTSFSPPQLHIPVYPSRVIRFQFSKMCVHWDFTKHGPNPGKPYVFVLKVGGKDGRKEDYVPFQSDGYWYWVDVRSEDLGARGMKTAVYTVEQFGGKSGRGLTVRDYEARKGRVGMSFGGVCGWELV